MTTQQPRISRFWPFPRVYYGWAIMTASMLNAAASVPMQGPIVGVFVRPMQDELGWSATSISIGFALGSGVGGISSIWVGRVLDRRGARGVTVTAGVILVGCMVGLAAMTQVWHFWGLFGLGRGPGGSPVGGVLLILMGVVFLLHSLGYWRLGDAARFWPVTLIALGIYLLYRRVKEQSAGAAPAPPEGSSGSALPSIRVSDPASPEDELTAAPESVAPPLDESPAEQTSRAPVEEPQRAG